MIYIKSIAIGIVGAVVAAVLWIVASFVLPIVFALLMAPAAGSGGIGAVAIDSVSILGAALIGFTVACYWQLRRLSKRRTQAR